MNTHEVETNKRACNIDTRDATQKESIKSGLKKSYFSHAFPRISQSISQSINQFTSPPPTERERHTQSEDPNLSTLSIPSTTRTPTQGALLADRVRIIHCTNLIDPERALPCSSCSRSSASTLSFLLVSCFLPARPSPSPLLLLALGAAVGALRSSSLWLWLWLWLSGLLLSIWLLGTGSSSVSDSSGRGLARPSSLKVV